MSAPWQSDVDLSRRHTLQLKSRAKQFVEVRDLNTLHAVLKAAQQQALPVLPLGEGSNVILGPSIEALVIRLATRGYRVLEQGQQGVTVEVAAGENWQQFIETCLAQGWHGLENLALIPGTVGAAPMQNIGAYGVEVAQFIESVQFVALPGYHPCDDPAIARSLQEVSAQHYSLLAKDCQFGYRDSIFKHALRDRVLVTAVRFKLNRQFEPQLDYPALQAYLQQHNKTATPNARELVDAVIAIRRAKLPDPAEVANAGSFFKNPVVNHVAFSKFIATHPDAPWFNAGRNKPGAESQAQRYKIPAGWLIEQCGFKGRDCGNVGMHAAQALVLVNRAAGRVAAAEVLAFAEQVAAAVQQRFGLQLEIEPRRYGC